MSDCLDCNCSDFDKCMRILNLVLDGEASAEEEEYFFSHIESCMICFAHFNVEKKIRELIKRKLNKKNIPIELVTDIRNKIVK